MPRPAPPSPEAPVGAAEAPPLVEPTAHAEPTRPRDAPRRIGPITASPADRPDFPLVPPPAKPVVAVPLGPDPWVAGLASLLLPGVGQIYAGQARKGGVLILLAFLTCMGLGTLNLVTAVDAYRVARRRERGEVLGPWTLF